MGIEESYKKFRNDTYRLNLKNQKQVSNQILSYEEGLEVIKKDEELRNLLNEEIDLRAEKNSKSKTVIKNKEYLRNLKTLYQNKVIEVVTKKGIRVREYPDVSEFVNNVVEDMVGYSSISELMNDDRVTDVYCIQWNKIYYESSQFKTPQKFKGSFKNEKEYKNFIERLMRAAGKGVLDNGENKVVDFDLYGDRYNAISKAVAPNDFVVTIRKHQEEHIKLNQIINGGCMTQEIADLIGTLILGECNIIIAGITGSGKTTTMRALLDYYVTKANKRMLVCEDTRELFPENDHSLELVTSKGSTEKTTVDLRDLVILALRQKPKYIVVGEVRGPEAESAVEAMATGHSTIFSMHAGKPIDAVNRLVTKYLMQMPSLGVDVVERIIGSALDYIIIQDDVPGTGRKITSITEVDYNYNTKRVALKTVMKYNFHTKQFDMNEKLSSEKAEKMLRHGIKIEDLDKYVDWNDKDKSA